MVKINFEEPTDDEWVDWRSRCDQATQELVENFQNGEPLVITKLYKEKKEIFFLHDNYFYGKCVYCESLIPASHPGDVEHFRPKGKVTDLNNKSIKVTLNGEEVAHPGYFWLAYEISNLMPSCEDCNRPSSGNSGGIQIGKWMKFPVNGARAYEPGQEVHERPLLINPLIEDPSEHLWIDKYGIIHPVEASPKGKTCIDMFGLNDRASLVNERRQMYKQVRNEVRLAANSIINRSIDQEEYKKNIKDYKLGKRPYTIAAIKAIRDEKEEYIKIDDL